MPPSDHVLGPCHLHPRRARVDRPKGRLVEDPQGAKSLRSAGVLAAAGVGNFALAQTEADTLKSIENPTVNCLGELHFALTEHITM